MHWVQQAVSHAAQTTISRNQSLKRVSVAVHVPMLLWGNCRDQETTQLIRNVCFRTARRENWRFNQQDECNNQPQQQTVPVAKLIHFEAFGLSDHE